MSFTLGLMGVGFGHAGLRGAGSAGPAAPGILLSNSTIIDNATVGSLVGVLTTYNTTGTYTWSLTSNPGGLFSISGANLNVATALTSGLKPITVQASGGVPATLTQPLTITVTPRVVNNYSLPAGTGSFTFTGEDMTPIAGYTLTAGGATGASGFALSGQSANLKPPVRGVSVTLVGANVVNVGNTGNSLVMPNINIGNPAYIATRRVFVVLTGAGSSGWNLIGGSIGSGTIDQFTNNSATAASSDVVEIVSALVTTGTTVTVTLNFSGNPGAGQVITVYHADQSLMTAPTAPITAMHQDNTGNDINTVTFNTTTKVNGFIICGVWAGGGNGPNITSSTDPFTTDYSVSAIMLAHANAITANPSYNIQTHAPPAGGSSMLASAAFS